MSSKTKEKEEAIKLRKKGLAYSEILEQIPVAKSTLSLWLRDVGLTKSQYQKLTKKKLDASKREGLVRKLQRIKRTEQIHKEASEQIKRISKQKLWYMGVMLYWAEGYKEKEWSRGVGLDFANSDPRMIKLHLKWLYEILYVKKEDIVCRIAIHENNMYRLDEIQKYWLNTTCIPLKNFSKVNIKKHKIRTVRKNTGHNYYGVLNVRVKRSSKLNRKIDGWVQGISKYYKF